MSDNFKHVTILEGPRASGKTSMGNVLTVLGAQTLKFRRLDDPIASMHRIMDLLPEFKPPVVIDRFHLTEAVMTLGLQRYLLPPYEEQAMDFLVKINAIHTRLIDGGAHIYILTTSNDEILAERAERVGRTPELPPSQSRALWALAALWKNVSVLRNDDHADSDFVLKEIVSTWEQDWYDRWTK